MPKIADFSGCRKLGLFSHWKNLRGESLCKDSLQRPNTTQNVKNQLKDDISIPLPTPATSRNRVMVCPPVSTTWASGQTIAGKNKRINSELGWLTNGQCLVTMLGQPFKLQHNCEGRHEDNS